jgi:hypothetical protein
MRELAEGLIEIPGGARPCGSPPTLTSATDRDLGGAAGPTTSCKEPSEARAGRSSSRNATRCRAGLGQMKANRGVAAFYQALVG